MITEDLKMSHQELWTHSQTQSTSIKHDLRLRYFKIRRPQSCLSKYCELGLPTCLGRLSHKIRWPSGGVFEPGLVNTPIKVNRPNLATNKAIQATLLKKSIKISLTTCIVCLYHFTIFFSSYRISWSNPSLLVTHSIVSILPLSLSQ